MATARRNRGEQATVAFGEALLRRRWLVLAACLLLAVISGTGMSKLEFRNDYRVYFGPTNPYLQAFESIQNIYTKNDNALFVITPADGDAFSPTTLAAVADLTEQGWQLPYSIRVDSVSNFQHMRVDGDDLEVEDLVLDLDTLSADELRERRAIAIAEPALHGLLINGDASVTAVNVTFQLPDSATKEALEAVIAIRALRDAVEMEYPQVEIRLTGSMMMNNAFFESSQRDLQTLVPAMFAGIFLIMWLALRSLAATLATLAVVILSVVTAMGLAGWLGIKLTSPSAAAPTVIMTLAVADCIHLLLSMQAARFQGLGRREAILDSLRINMQPVFLTSLTTAIGFLTMNFSDSPPFHDLGNITAIGVMAAFFYAIVFLPALATLLPLQARAGNVGRSSMDRLANLVLRHRKALLYGGLACAAVIVACVPRNELDDEFVKYFDQSIDFRNDTDYTQQHLTGIAQIHYSLPAGGANGISDPVYLARMSDFAAWLREQPGVTHVASISDTMRRLNRDLNGGDPQLYVVPEESDLAAQYLLVYEMSLPFGLDLNNQLNIDKSASHLVASARDLSSQQLIALTDASSAWLAQYAPGMEAPGIGIAVMFAHISERNIRSMLGGTLLGLIVISGVLLIALRDWRLGLLSLVPNLLPAALTFGFWGIFVGQINMAASVVAAMSLGIVVDDTVHFLSKYQRARRERGLSPEDAIRFAFSTVGMALLVTTIILAAGFLVLAQSPFAINAVMAQLTAIAIVLALVVDFLLLPALLLRLDRDGPVSAAGELATQETPRAATT